MRLEVYEDDGINDPTISAEDALVLFRDICYKAKLTGNHVIPVPYQLRPWSYEKSNEMNAWIDAKRKELT